MKKLSMIALAVIFFAAISEVSAQYVNADSLSKKVSVFVNAGLQESFFISEKAFGANFSVGFGANWGKKVSFGFEAQVEDLNIYSTTNFSGGNESLLKNLSNIKVGPTLVMNFKKLNLATVLSVGWLTGKVDQYDSESKKRIKSEINLITLGISQKVSYSFLGWKNLSVSAFLKAGVDGMKDDLLLRPGNGKKKAYLAFATFGLELSMFPQKLN